MIRKQGFTLIELLVVIAVISVLSTIVMASLSAARDKARIAAAQQFSTSVYRTIGDQSVGIYDFRECSGATAGDGASVAGIGTLTGGPTWSNDTVSGNGCSLLFDGVNDYVISTNNLGIFGNAEFTMCSWIKWNGNWISDWPSFMGNNSTSIVNQGLSFTVKDGRPALDFWGNRFRASRAISANVWHSVCATKSAGVISATTKLYVDGVIVPGAVEGTDGTPNIIDSRAVIGRLDSSRWFNGNIYGAHFFTRSLLASEVKDIYAKDISTHQFLSLGK